MCGSKAATSVIKQNSPPKLGGVAASLASSRGGFLSRILQESGLENHSHDRKQRDRAALLI